MTQVLEFIQKIKLEYNTAEMPFMQLQLERVKRSKPYLGLKVLQNIPFTRETIIKLEILIQGGANLTATSPSFMEVDTELLKAYKRSGGIFSDIKDLKNELFDVHLDCAAELLEKAPPRIGTVEITGTGTNKYGEAGLNYPVISVDMSAVKNLEGVLGTGEAFVRAFKQLTGENISGKNFMVFGYGKVGRGMAHYLKKEKANVYVVELNPVFLKDAAKLGFKTINAQNTSEVESIVPAMFCVATATGRENVISSKYDASFFKGRYLANMGGDDEFGKNFGIDEVMCQKRPINFFIEKPTLMRYLDPVFYAHNMGIDILVYNKLNSGLHPFPKFIAEETVQRWTQIFNENVNI